ncbi:hypothetical protein [Cytobacillus sp. NCCP-133]|uniref:hypothetical protein n=1 Tax=Cytobacillus sp. NCCP-133 TaxID=766848 RepID=UPI00223152D3|nr:hypothetical protein [Cytobacillus sp. NCCP-133]GLB61461.1 hypothetical protein NCCP133_35900 [Cytobacillus sp. NCCP-133]
MKKKPSIFFAFFTAFLAFLQGYQNWTEERYILSAVFAAGGILIEILHTFPNRKNPQ